jgi:eukaryotic-like serine/threonine-protein kinase
MSDSIVPQPRQFARYSLTRELRREAATTIYLALDPVMHREVVLKVVQLPPPSDAGHNQEAEIAPLEQAFVRQAQAAGKLNHPHIVTVFEAGRLNNLGYLAIERVNGRPLHELIASGWRPQFVHAASIGARVADALEHAHAQDVAHGHLGPMHVLLQADGVPKVEGFGGWIDNGTGGDDALHRTEKLLPYFHNELTEEMRARDVKAVAGLVYMMVTGKAPGPQPAPLASVRSDAPAVLARLLDETLNPAAGRAHRSAGDLRDGLTAFIWNARKDNVAPATLGIPLAAPPREAPDGPTQVRPPTAGRPTSELLTRTVEPARPRSLGALRTVRMAAPPAAGQAREERRPDPGQPAVSLLQTLKTDALPWLRKNPIALGAVGAFVIAAIVLAMLLATFAGKTTAPAATAAAALPAPIAAPAPVGEGSLLLSVLPWGEVIVDGKPMGVSPPLTELRLPAGRHAVEIRYNKSNGETAAVTAQVDIDPAKPLQIKHSFE